jgi:hypothetical protein
MQALVALSYERCNTTSSLWQEAQTLTMYIQDRIQILLG